MLKIRPFLGLLKRSMTFTSVGHNVFVSWPYEYYARVGIRLIALLDKQLLVGSAPAK